MKQISDEAHWEIDKIGKYYDVSLFFLKLTLLFSNNVYLAIVDGDYSLEMMAFIQVCSLQNIVLPLHHEFDKADIIPINEKTMIKLAELANRHAGPEIAGHLAVSNLKERLLEWFDFPFDPIAVSPSISEESINRFCVEIGAKYKISE